MTEPEIDVTRYAACEQQKVGNEWRYVRLHDEPIELRDVLPWLEEHAFVKRVKNDHSECDLGYDLVGWGTTYFAVPWDKSVAR